MADIERFFLWFVSFFGVLSVFGIFLGYLHLIYFPVSLIAIVLAGYLAWRIVRNINISEIRCWRPLFFVVFLLLAIDLYVSLPYLIYPHSYVDFGMNVAQARLITNDGGFPSFSHVYPNVYYGVFALFNSLLFHAYTLSSVIAIVMQVMTVFAVFLIGREALDEKTGLIAAFVYGFSLVNILLLEQGYLTQNFGTFFFASSLYLVIKVIKEKSYRNVLILSLAGLVSYPHYFAILFLYVLLYQRKLMKYLLFSVFLMSVEIIGLAAHYIGNRTTVVNSFVMHGGIVVPNIFVLIPYFLGFVGILFFLRIESKKSDLNLAKLVFLILGIMGFFVMAFLVNCYIYTWRNPDIRQLYTVVKILYLLIVPVSVFSAFILRKSIRYSINILIFFALIYSIYFVNYAFIIDGKDNLLPGIYYSSEHLIEINQNHSLGFDYGVLQTTWEQPYIYETLYGRADNYTQFSMGELKYLLQNEWGWDENKKSYRSGSNLEINYTRDDVDFYLTPDYLGESCTDLYDFYLCSIS